MIVAAEDVAASGTSASITSAAAVELETSTYAASVTDRSGSSPATTGRPVTLVIGTPVTLARRPSRMRDTRMSFGMVMVRILPEEDQPNGDWLKLVTPSGKIGYVSGNVLAPFGSDQLCYQKDGGGWKIAGYIGAGTGQE